MLNFGFGISPGFLFITSILASWAWSTFIESIVWIYILNRQGARERFTVVVGWMALVQTLSTALSFGVAFVVYGAMIWLLPMPLYFDIYQQAVSILWNPVGVFIGFFLTPILLEFFIWHQGWRWFQVTMRISAQHEEVRFTTLILLAGVVIANACSFLFIFLISIVNFLLIFVMVIGCFLVFIIFANLLWFLYSNRRIASPWFQDEPNENDSSSEGINR